MPASLLYSVLSPAVICGAYPISLRGSFVFSLHEVLISLPTLVDSLYAVLSFCGPMYAVLFSLFLVANSSNAVFAVGYINGASLSLDLKRGPVCPCLNCVPPHV